ncbi:MAG TPA: triacylglycerol lipase [Pseudomonadales bacterium]|nr:triacylglycerol lipase [Pseudomonadales bacterium]
MKNKLLFLLILFCVSPAVFSDDYTQTRYPIVLVHTFLGFEKIGQLEYWYGIPAALQSGGAQVFTARVSTVNSSEARGEQLLAQVEEILAITGAEKVNLIGHSHGGETARYVAAMIPEKVASVTSIGSPVKGTPAADIVKKWAADPRYSALILKLLNGLAVLVDSLSGAHLPQDAAAGLDALTTEGNLAFNEKFPAGVPATACGEGAYQENNVRFFSWAGSYPGVTNYSDPSSYALVLTKVFFNEPSNGLIGRCSSHFGQVIRDNYAMDHLDEVNQLFGLTNPSANPLTIYREHANRLKNGGL